MKVIKSSIFLFLVLILAACNINRTEEKKESNYSSEKKGTSFIFSTWITYDEKKTDEDYHTEFKKYKDNGITEVLVNTQANPQDLKRLVPIAKAEGITLHAWMMAVNRPDDKVALEHPDWYMVNRKGESCFDKRPYVDYYQWLCPTRKESRQHILDLVTKLSKVEGIESVHLDYIRFPDIFLPVGLLPNYNLKQEEELPQFDYCYCDVCVSTFEKIHHKNSRKMKNPAIDSDWRQFRFNRIRSIVNEAYEIAHKNGKKLTAAVFPYPEMAGMMVRQRWDKWKIDRVYPMIYQNFYNEEIDWVGYATKQGVEDVSRKNIGICTGIYVPPITPDELKQAIQLAKDNGAEGVSFYDGPNITDEQLKVIREMATSNM